MEACSGAHHWARLFCVHGHTVKLMAPKLVAPYRMSGKRGKNDAADAAAICEAMTRPNMRFTDQRRTAARHPLLAWHPPGLCRGAHRVLQPAPWVARQIWRRLATEARPTTKRDRGAPGIPTELGQPVHQRFAGARFRTASVAGSEAWLSVGDTGERLSRSPPRTRGWPGQSCTSATPSSQSQPPDELDFRETSNLQEARSEKMHGARITVALPALM